MTARGTRDPSDLTQVWQEAIRTGHRISDSVGVSQDELEALYNAAHVYYVKGDYAASLRLFAQLVQLDHGDGRFLMGLGACQQMLGQYSDAIVQYIAASIVQPDDPAPLYHCAQCLIGLDQVDAACDTLELARQRCPDEHAGGVCLKCRQLLSDLKEKE